MKVQGTARVPGDKSISHRSLILGALADGPSRIRGLLRSADVASTADVLRALGADVPRLGDDLLLRGGGLRGLRQPRTDLDCGNSGTTTRLIAGVVAGYPFAARFVGDASLSRRPMRRVARPLEAMGAAVELERGDGLPMIVRGGALRPIAWRTDTASAQIKSAILLAGLVGGVAVTVEEPTRSRDHTERMLSARGVLMSLDGTAIRLEPARSLSPADVRVPADPSSAAFFAGLAALADGGELTLADVCVNETRTGFFAALRRMGASVAYCNERTVDGEPVADVVAAPNELRGVAVGAAEVPSMIDELPLLACVAARADGETSITGAGELRVKESDRIAAVVANLRAVGASAEELSDGMRVVGSRAPLRGRVTTFGDHRLAMAFGVLGAASGGAIQVDDPACVDVSYPGFWDDLAAATRR